VLLAVGAMLAFGSPIDAALQVALLSSPVVFLGGFMFSEPLTLPPLRRQQLVVAVVYALPLWLSALNLPTIALLSPALALIVGNVVAFFFGQRRGIKLTLSSRRQLTPTTWEFGFTPTAPVQFRPGQYMELTLPHRPGDARGYRRIFSIASAPADGSIAFAIKFSEKTSTFKSALAALPLGTQLRATSVGGDFLLPEDARTPVLLIAGGIGITPYIAQLTEAAARDTVLVYSVTSPDELVYAEELERSGIRVLLIAPQSPPELPDTWRYLGAARLSAATLQAEVPALAERVVYVSGPPAMVAELKAALHAAGVHRVVSDYFTGY
jgi:ferredoxin-NADP reductase